MESSSLGKNDLSPGTGNRSFHPSLYTTPQPQRQPSPIPYSFSPSPYIVNYKRRAPLPNVGIDDRQTQRQDGFHTVDGAIGEVHTYQEKGKYSVSGTAVSQLKMETFIRGSVGRADEKPQKVTVREALQETENDVFQMEVDGVHAQGNHLSSENWESSRVSVACGTISSSQQMNPPMDTPAVCSCSYSSVTEEEFFDAPETPLEGPADEEASSQSGIFFIHNQTTQGGLDKKMILRLHDLLRCSRVEEALTSLQLQLYHLTHEFSSVGIPVRPCEGFGAIKIEQELGDLFKQFNQNVLIARLVGGALVRGALKADKEGVLQDLLEIKNREIASLQEKLQYYELVNHEISQKNQEAAEIIQMCTQKCWKRQRWALSCITGALFVGTVTLMSYKFFPWKEANLWNLRLGSLTCQHSVEHGSNGLAGSR
eukprot:c23833_g1_i1 orf=518-1795(+)